MNDCEESSSFLKRFLDNVDYDICSYIEGQKLRFTSCNILLNKFRNRKNYWQTQGQFTKEITEVVNELCVAKLILSDHTNRCAVLEYEPVHEKSNKSIDFFLVLENGIKVYCDVKTIHPDSVDSWGKFEQAIEGNKIPHNISVDIYRDWGGGQIWHEWEAARGKMLLHAKSLEDKVEQMEITDSVIVMLFCGNGHKLRLDLLEDFADFYHTRRHRQDDTFSLMEAHYISSKGITIQRSIDHFAYVERMESNINHNNFVRSVRGPEF